MKKAFSAAFIVIVFVTGLFTGCHKNEWTLPEAETGETEELQLDDGTVVYTYCYKSTACNEKGEPVYVCRVGSDAWDYYFCFSGNEEEIFSMPESFTPLQDLKSEISGFVNDIISIDMDDILNLFGISADEEDDASDANDLAGDSTVIRLEGDEKTDEGSTNRQVLNGLQSKLFIKMLEEGKNTLNSFSYTGVKSKKQWTCYCDSTYFNEMKKINSALGNTETAAAKKAPSVD